MGIESFDAAALEQHADFLRQLLTFLDEQDEAIRTTPNITAEQIREHNAKMQPLRQHFMTIAVIADGRFKRRRQMDLYKFDVGDKKK